MWEVPILIDAGSMPLVTKHSLYSKGNHCLDTNAMLLFVTHVIGVMWFMVICNEVCNCAG